MSNWMPELRAGVYAFGTVLVCLWLGWPVWLCAIVMLAVAVGVHQRS